MALYYRNRRKKIFFFIIIPLTLCSLIAYFYIKISPTFIYLSEEKIYSVCFNLINSVVSNEVSEISSKNIIDYKFDSNNNIVAINANVVTMNVLNTKIAEEIMNGLSSIDEIYVNLPIGSFISNKLFPAIGPTIPIKIIPLSTVHTEYRTEFTSTGINQTCHKIFIKINCTLNVLSALSTKTQEINIEIPIAETIIIGNVPQTYLQISN